MRAKHEDRRNVSACEGKVDEAALLSVPHLQFKAVT